MIDRKIVWNDAATSGLVLGGVSIAYMLCNILLGKLQGGTAVSVIVNVSSVLLWVFKFILCIRLMKLFMQKFAARHEDVSNRDTFSFGSATALLSALLYSGFFLAWVLFVQPDMFKESIDLALGSYDGVFSAAQMETMEEMIPKLPAMTFFVNLFWCWLFGVVLSAIFSRDIPPRNPFVNNDSDNN